MKQKHKKQRLNKGIKYDSNKLEYDLIPPKALEELVRVLMHGSSKYGRYQWVEGFEWTRLLNATARHLEAFKQGIDHDEESGLLHLGHAACNIMFLLEHYKRNIGKDNRFKWNLK